LDENVNSILQQISHSTSICFF